MVTNMRLILTAAMIALVCMGTETAAQQVKPAVTSALPDTLPHFMLKEAHVYGRNLKRRRKRDARLEYNVRKAYPYARIAALKISEIDARVSAVSNRKDRRRVIKEEYRRLMRDFKKPLMHLSIAQGRILIRLIYRETNNSAFAHIKEYKGSVNAVFWQSIALLFGNNLKADYDPLGRDADIEAIVQEINRESKG